jgi:predicted Zn-dependent protease
VLDYTCTVRTEDGRGSGWVGTDTQDATRFKVEDDIQIAMRKASASSEARALEPGKYTVILEPMAAAGLIGFMFNFFGAREADEGRSFLSKAGGGNKIGQQVFGPQVNFYTDPWDPVAPSLPWDEDGVPRKRMDLVKDGKVVALDYSRYWAQKQGKAPVGQMGNILMTGGTKSTAELVRSTQRGVLVTRTWYIRMVDPQTVLLTGLTRDGTFYIENGQIKYPIKNFRFNESPVIMLNNVEELGKPVRVPPDEVSMNIMVPPMKLRDFTFTSLSDAV